MIVMYKGYIEMNDGTKNSTLLFATPIQVRNAIKKQMGLTIRYFKKDGVDYGAMGKVFTYEEEHNGLKQAKIVEFTKTAETIINDIWGAK